jgi:branched-chain amino acid aminotransferase
MHNGKLVPIEQMRLSPGQAGLLSGWGLFTTLRIVEGIPFAYERHWARLQRDALRTHIPFPFDAEKVRAQVDELLHANQVKEGATRIYIVWNKVGFWQSDEPAPEVDLILYTAGLPQYRETARLALREHGRHAASPLCGVKVTSWLNNVWNLYEAQQRGFDEVVLLNEHGEVAECTTANLFCVKAGTVATPPRGSGCLGGVTRSILLEIGEGAGVPVHEEDLLPRALFEADEVFISSTTRSLLPVAEIEGRIMPEAPGPVTKKLERVFGEYVKNYIASHAARAAKA